MTGKYFIPDQEQCNLYYQRNGISIHVLLPDYMFYSIEPFVGLVDEAPLL